MKCTLFQNWQNITALKYISEPPQFYSIVIQVYSFHLTFVVNVMITCEAKIMFKIWLTTK